MAQKSNHDHSVDKPSVKRDRSKTEKSSEKLRKSKSSKSKVKDDDSALRTKSQKSTKVKSEKVKFESETIRKRVSEPTLTMAELLVPELSRASSRNSLPYPTFSRAYSKESFHIPKINTDLPAEKPPPTPVMTDFGSDGKLDVKSEEQPQAAPQRERPPSPPETDIDQQKKPLPKRMSQVKEEIEDEEIGASKISLESNSSTDGAQSRLSVASNKLSDASTPITSKRKTTDEGIDVVQNFIHGSRYEPEIKEVQDQARSDLETTKQSSTNTYSFSNCPKTPTQNNDLSSQYMKDTPSSLTAFEVPNSATSEQNLLQGPHRQKNLSVPMPLIDYLLQNGGLRRQVTKKFVSHSSTTKRSFMPLPTKVEEVFGSCHSLLDHYDSVLQNNGSLAVATGYRSVARRLLDRLEVVMGRSLSAEGCSCLMCQTPDLASDEASKALAWGEILEWSSGRKELPIWPTFDFSTLGVKAPDDILGGKIHIQDSTRSCSPVKMDPDIADEFREFYLKQSKKTKLAVDQWLSGCPIAAATPPQEVDDETLSFSILTHLPEKERPIFNALVTGSTTYQPSNLASVFLRRPRSEFLSKTALSIQRLYRLPTSPRLPEVAIYLLRNPKLHNVLAAISEINIPEWEILTSGRFDGFLWSGADSDHTNSLHLQSQSPSPSTRSLNSTTISSGNHHSRTASSISASQMSMKTFSMHSRDFSKSASVRRPVLNDQETEIAVLSEVEREIYMGMEALEDAFETLHRKAELVRRALRERGASLALSLQSHKLSQPMIQKFDQSDPPVSGLGLGYERPKFSDGNDSDIPSDSEWDPGDDFSEIVPDDSASNISILRKRRPNRRNERRAPTLVEEDDE